MPTIGVYADEFIEPCGEAEGIQSGASYTKKTPKAVSILLRLFQPKSKIGENNMRKILLLFLGLVVFLNCSCSSETYTREAPYTVDLNGFEFPETITLKNNTDVYDKRGIDDFLYAYEDGRLVAHSNAILLVEPISSTSYYLNQGKSDRGGYTVTELKVEVVLEGGGTWKDTKESGDIIKCIQLFTVQPDGKCVFPQYDYIDCINDIYLSNQYSRKIMEIGKRYLCFYGEDFVIRSEDNYGFLLNGGPDSGKFVCYYPDSSKGEMCVLNRSKDDYSVSKMHYCRVYEFSEEAYEASKAITTEYEAEGKTVNDGSYYHYHGMVVEAWERYSEKLNSDAEN